MRLALVGMSRAGKTHLSQRLAQVGYEHLWCDHLIELELREELAQSDGTRTSLAGWMGWPDDGDYAERADLYQCMEQVTLAAVLGRLRTDLHDAQNVVVDTTGSVIYLDRDILNALCELVTVVHLETPSSVRDAMWTSFQAEPTPLIWADFFSWRKGESRQEALTRSYKDLLEDREKQYAALADVTIGYDERRETGFDLVRVVQGRQGTARDGKGR